MPLKKTHPGPMGAVKGLEIPTYNEYFILGSGNVATTVAPSTNSNVAPGALPTNLLLNMAKFSDSIEYASSYDPDVSYGFSDTPSAQADFSGPPSALPDDFYQQ